MDFSNVQFSEDTATPTPETSTTPTPETSTTPTPETSTTPTPESTISTPETTTTPIKKTTAKKVLKAVDKTATGKAASDQPAPPKKDTSAPIADTAQTADGIKKIKDDDTARAHAEMWVFTIDTLLSSTGYFLTGNPSSRYELTPSQKTRYKEISHQYFKVASWGISPALAFFMQTATIFGMVGMLILFDYKEKKKKEKMLYDAILREQQQQAQQAQEKAAREQQREQEKYAREQEREQEKVERKNTSLPTKNQLELEEERAMERAEQTRRELLEYKTQTIEAKPEASEEKPAAKPAAKRERKTDAGTPPDTAENTELTAEYLAQQHEILSTRKNFEVYEAGHEYEGHYIKDNSHQREKYENLRRYPERTRPSALIQYKLNEFKSKGFNAVLINKKLRLYLTALREKFGITEPK